MAGDEEFHLPYTRRPAHPGPDLHAPAGDDAGTVTSGIVRPRTPPKGLNRRDRSEWRRLELVRVQRETQAAEQFSHGQRTGWQQGFFRNPPRGLGRRARKAWLDAERGATTAWWEQRRASTEDIDARSIGVLVVALLLGGGLIWGLMAGHHDGSSDAGASAAVTGAAPLPVAAPRSATAAVTSTAQPDDPRTTDVVPGPGNKADAGAVGTAAGQQLMVAGRWQPTPPGGVTPITPASGTAVDPGSVAVQPIPHGPPSAAQMSTPVGAVTAWLARTCPSTWTDTYGADLRRGAALMTTAGWAAADPAKDTAGPGLWKTVVADRQTRVCGDFLVQLSADLPVTGGVAFVGYSVDRLVTAPNGFAAVEHLVGARAVVRQPSGQWLVDRAVIGG